MRWRECATYCRPRSRSPIVIVGVTPENFNGTQVSATSDLTLSLAKAAMLEANALVKSASVCRVRLMGRVRRAQEIRPLWHLTTTKKLCTPCSGQGAWSGNGHLSHVLLKLSPEEG